MHKKTELICGVSELKPNFEEIGNNPNFVFENDPNFEEIGNNPNFVFNSDPNFEPITLFNENGNTVLVNSWLECANYVNGGWTNDISDFLNGEKYLFFGLTLILLVASYFQKKYNFLKRV